MVALVGTGGYPDYTDGVRGTEAPSVPHRVVSVCCIASWAIEEAVVLLVSAASKQSSAFRVFHVKHIWRAGPHVESCVLSQSCH